MNDTDIEATKKAVERGYGFKAFFIEDVAVFEQFGSQKVWQGIVHVFKISGHPQTDTCYAWSSPIEGSTKRRYYVVLKIPPIDSPEKAVRASIIRDYRRKINKS